MINNKIVVKRPLATACLFVVLLLYLLSRYRGLPQASPEIYTGQVTITGKVYKKEEASQFGVTSMTVYLKNVKAETEQLTGEHCKRVICYLRPEQPPPELGSIVRVEGKCEGFESATNPGQFDLFFYYQILGISCRLNQTKILTKTTEYHYIQELLYQIRCQVGAVFNASLEPKEAAAMKAMLLGEKNSMDKDIKELYQRNGIAHILAISGLHISMIGMGLLKLLKKAGLSVRVAGVISSFFIIAYGIMIGFSPSSLRAIIMFLLHMLAKVMRRTYDTITAVAVVAVLLVLEQPLYLYHSGFVFSFGCVLGIGILIPVLTKGRKLLRWEAILGLRQVLLSGFAMAVITLPIYLWFYFQFPVYSVFLNLLVIPIMTLLMLAGLLVIPVAILFPIATEPIALFIKGVFILYETACRYCEEFPGYLFTPGRPAIWQMIVFFLILGGVVLCKKKLCLPIRWLLTAIAVFLLVIRPTNGLLITFLDVGQGDCIFIRNGSFGDYLIDGGSTSASGVGTYRIIPFLKYMGASSLEAVFVTHADQDHCNGILELLTEGKQQGIEVKALILPEIAEISMDHKYQELAEMAAANGIRVLYISQGDRIENHRLSLTCIHPTADYQTMNTNEYSTVLLLEYEEFSALFTGDVEGTGEQHMERYLEEERVGVESFAKNLAKRGQVRKESLAEGLQTRRLTVLKVAHHGSANSTDSKILELLQPSVSIISCGKKNPYGHPHEELLERLEWADSRIYNTAKSGAITFVTDGSQVKIQQFVTAF